MRVLRTVFRRKLRAFLTIFGITIGVVALVVMGALAEKLQLLVDGGVDYYSNKVVVTGPGGIGGIGTEPLSRDFIGDLEAIDGVTRASGSIMMPLDEELSAVTFGVPANINGADGRAEGYESFEIRFADGRGIEPSERGAVVVGSDLVTRLDAEVGGQVVIRGETFEVVGILEKTLTVPDQAVLMSLEDAQDLYVASLPTVVRETVDAREIVTSIAVYLEEGRDPDMMAEVIGEEYPEVVAVGPEGFRTSVEEPLSIFNQIIYAVAFISLLVGGLSVINTMTMSVAERTREIGVRKAIGASDGAIMRQFISESAAIGLIGGLGGLLAGWGIVVAANSVGAASGTELFLLTPRLTVGAVAFAVFLGVLAGLFPAWHAARLNPVEALRHE